MSLQVVYEDDDIIVTDKQAGILSIPDRYDQNKVNIRDQLIMKYGEIFTVHRLDKETSGLICFAKTKEAHSFLNEQFQNNEVYKRYFLISYGQIVQQSFEVRKYLKKSGNNRVIISTAKDGKESKTNFQLIEKFRHFTFLEAVPFTGRTHQIRVHIADYGFPIVADKVYSNKHSVKLSDFKHSIKGETSVLINRQALHATELILKSPSGGKTMEFRSEIPNDMKILLKVLRKYDK